MTREFNRNMFVMLFSIMIGVIIITYFGADIINRSKIDDLTTQYEGEITTAKGEIIFLKSESENFTSRFIKSTVLLDQAREDRAYGNYNFDLAFLWYQSALSERNITQFELYKIWGIDNCTYAMPNYYYSRLNFEEAEDYYNETLSYAGENYLDVIDLYVKLTESGSKLTMLRYDASRYLMYLLENLTYDILNNNATFLGNMTGLMMLFEGAMAAYGAESEIYEDIQDDLDDYEFFEEIR